MAFYNIHASVISLFISIIFALNTIAQPDIKTIHIDINYFAQEEGPWCGPAATQMALNSIGIVTSPDGQNINQKLLSGSEYLNTANLWYSAGLDIKNTLNSIIQDDVYTYSTIDYFDTKILEEDIYETILKGYVPILALWQTKNSWNRIINYPFGNYELRHFIPISGVIKESQGLPSIVTYKDPVPSFYNKYSSKPIDIKIDSDSLMELNLGGSRVR